jgi:hypothetical protein
MPNHQFGGPPLSAVVTVYSNVRSYPPYLEAVSSIRNLRARHALMTRNPPNMYLE